VEDTPTSECPAADRGDDIRDPVRNGIGLDGKREHQRFCQGTSGCKPVGTGRCGSIHSPTAVASDIDDRVAYPARRRR